MAGGWHSNRSSKANRHLLSLSIRRFVTPGGEGGGRLRVGPCGVTLPQVKVLKASAAPAQFVF
jgi:hypothetical protein